MRTTAVKHHITLGDKPISYTLIRGARKTIRLNITHHGLELRVPLSCSEHTIHQTLSTHANWIITKLAQAPQPYILQAGQTISWLGNTLSLIPNAPYSHLTASACYLAAPNENWALQQALTVLYKQMALPYLHTRTHYWAEKMQLMPKKILLSNARKCWGSCNHRGEVRLNWRLMQAPAECIDYVVIHELAHLREMNHSAKFWQIVSQHCADYVQKRKQLNTFSLYNFC
jgi:predicted metal-dependent hydrolase